LKGAPQGALGGKDMTFDKVRDIIVEQLQVEPDQITPDTSLMKDLEADSLDAVEIIMGIETEFDIEIPDDEAEKFQSIGDIVSYVDSKTA
jgi:acyl carrier protein